MAETDQFAVNAMFRIRSAFTILLLFLTCGCHTGQKSHDIAVTSFVNGDLAATQAELARAHARYRSEQQILELDHGILDLATGDVRQAEARFRTIKSELEHLQQKDLTEQASSLMTDGRAVAWSGRDFERRMVLNLALLSSLVGDRQDAFAWSMQVAEASHERRTILTEAANKAAEQAIADHPVQGTAESVPESDGVVRPAGFESAPDSSRVVSPQAALQDQPLALGAYLSALIQSEQPMRNQETQAFLEDLALWNPDFARQQQLRNPGEMGVRCQPGNGTLHVIALIGQAPAWVSESAAPTSAALLIADRIISATGKQTLPPTIAAVKIARPEPRGFVLPCGQLHCSVAAEGASGSSGSTLAFATAVDLNVVAEASYREHRDEQIAQVVVRRVLKKGAIYALKETQKIHRNSLVDLGVNVAGVAWEAMEKADTRSWRLLPARVDIARIELPAGNWTAQIRTGGPGTGTTTPAFAVPVADGRNSCVVLMIPNDRPTGHILIGGPEQRAIPVDAR